MTDSLSEALEILRTAIADFDREGNLRTCDANEELKPLAKTVQAIGYDGPLKPPICPERYREQWEEYLSGRRQQLESSGLSFLCWDPRIATDARFHQYLDAKRIPLTSRKLLGLVTSAHQQWSRELAKGQIGDSLRRRLRNAPSSSPRLLKWKQNIGTVLGVDAPLRLGEELLRELCSIDEKCAAWGLFEHSAFIQLTAEGAAETCLRCRSADLPPLSFLVDNLLGWRGWEQASFKDQLAKWILSRHSAELDQLREKLKPLALDRLGDPRLPRNDNHWQGVAKEAKDEFIRWLSREDIDFFFEHVLPRGSDPHGRKDFWLRYVRAVKRSRPLLNPLDRRRLRIVQLRKSQELGHYGSVDGVTSAFLLDFGELLVIEFSAKGNACYVYRRPQAARVVPNFWTDETFSVAKAFGGFGAGPLKQKHSALFTPLKHDPERKWWSVMSNELAKYGIRPETGR